MADLRYITLTGTLTRGAGPTPASGFVQVASVRTVEAPGADRLITSQPGRPVQLDTNGHFAVQVVASDDPALAADVLVELKLLLEDSAPEVRVYRVITSGDTIDVADCTALPRVPPDGDYITAVSWEVVGRPGGVAPIDDQGKIPTQYLPPSAGGVSAYHHVQNVASDTWVITHGLGYRPVFSFQDHMGRQIGAGWQLEHAPDLMTTYVQWPAEISGTADGS